MTDKPILFSAPMVRAILAGHKTQTRRVIKPISPGKPKPLETWQVANGGPYFKLPCHAGYRLWVREAWRTHEAYDDLAPSALGGEEPVRYEADGAHQTWGYPAIEKIGRARPGMFMPRWASRITLLVKAVKVERLQDISRGDAMAEGCPFPNMAAGPNPRYWFHSLWCSLNAPGSWDADPWVAAITFRPVIANIDSEAAT